MKYRWCQSLACIESRRPSAMRTPFPCSLLCVTLWGPSLARRHLHSMTFRTNRGQLHLCRMFSILSCTGREHRGCHPNVWSSINGEVRHVSILSTASLPRSSIPAARSVGSRLFNGHVAVDCNRPNESREVAGSSRKGEGCADSSREVPRLSLQAGRNEEHSTS